MAALEALDAEDKDYAGLKAIRESRETLAGRRTEGERVGSSQQRMLKVSEGVSKTLEETVRRLIEAIEDDEVELPVSVKDKLISPVVTAQHTSSWRSSGRIQR